MCFCVCARTREQKRGGGDRGRECVCVCAREREGESRRKDPMGKRRPEANDKRAGEVCMGVRESMWAQVCQKQERRSQSEKESG